MLIPHALAAPETVAPESDLDWAILISDFKLLKAWAMACDLENPEKLGIAAIVKIAIIEIEIITSTKVKAL
jgi:hypothetical protein